MKYKLRSILKVSVTVIGIVVSSLLFSGCEDSASDTSFVFENNSSYRITLYVGRRIENIPFNPQGLTLDPGAKHVEKFETNQFMSNILEYDWKPKSTVAAREVNDKTVIFENK